MVGLPILRQAFLFGIVLYIWGMQWEYKILIDIDTHDNCDTFNELGLQGWEMYAVIQVKNETTFYFKRKIS